MKNLKDSYVLSNGVKIPCVGFGTWQTPDYLNLEDSVRLLRRLEAMGEDIAKVIESTKEGGKLWKIKL